MVVLVRGGGPTQVLAFPPQQFLDDPKYSSDEDLPSKLEAFKSEGTAVGVEKGVRRVGFLQEERGRKKQSLFFKKIILSIYYLFLFILAELGLHCSGGFSLGLGSRGFSLVVLHGLLILRARGLQ